MAKIRSHRKSGRGRIHNRSPLPRFIGWVPTAKSRAKFHLVAFQSIAEMCTILFLIWAKSIIEIVYEEDQIHGRWPDYRVTLSSFEPEWINTKYSRESLKDDEKEDLEEFQKRCDAEHRRHRVIYREDLQKDGFIEVIRLLHRYGQLRYPESTVVSTLRRYADGTPAFLEEWQVRARRERVPVDLVYHLLYHERLPLLFRPLEHTALQRCLS